ncbi:MFS general substrate transporter [Meredithblackwellia eburnea MCA 4105]
MTSVDSEGRSTASQNPMANPRGAEQATTGEDAAASSALSGPQSTSPTPTLTSDSPPMVAAPSSPYAPGERDAKDRPLDAEGGTRDLFVIPIPKRLQWNPLNPPKFTLLLNAIFGFSATFTVANLYYPQAILIQMADNFHVPYHRVTNVPTLLQASYAVGLLTICPMGDLVRRRQLLLLLVLCSSIASLILALVQNILGFEILSFVLGLVSVTPQVLLPLAADLAPADRRASAISIVLSGLLLGILCARVLSGAIAQEASIAVIYWMSFGLQCLIWIMLWATVPDYPAKNPHLRYIDILMSMAKYAVTEPVLVQSCLIATAASAVFSCFWTTSTFLLGGIYGYDSLEIGLFGLVGICGVCTAPFVGRLVDRLVPWLGVLLGISLLAVSQILFTAAAGVSVGVVIVTIFILDVGQQGQQVSNSSRIFAINAAARARLSAVYIFSIFCGQLIGTKAGTTVYLNSGYRASGGLCLGLIGWMLMILLLRGPHLPIDRWVGWAGGWELRKAVADRKRAEKAEREKASEKAIE